MKFMKTIIEKIDKNQIDEQVERLARNLLNKEQINIQKTQIFL